MSAARVGGGEVPSHRTENDDQRDHHDDGRDRYGDGQLRLALLSTAREVQDTEVVGHGSLGRASRRCVYNSFVAVGCRRASGYSFNGAIALLAASSGRRTRRNPVVPLPSQGPWAWTVSSAFARRTSRTSSFRNSTTSRPPASRRRWSTAVRGTWIATLKVVGSSGFRGTEEPSKNIRRQSVALVNPLVGTLISWCPFASTNTAAS